jgi:hypothetical protein
VNLLLGTYYTCTERNNGNQTSFSQAKKISSKYNVLEEKKESHCNTNWSLQLVRPMLSQVKGRSATRLFPTTSRSRAIARSDIDHDVSFSGQRTGTKRKRSCGHFRLKCIYRKGSGYALVANGLIQCGEVLITEDPVINIQTPGNEVSNQLVCERCNHPVLGLRKQLKEIGSCFLPPYRRLQRQERVGFRCDACKRVWCEPCSRREGFERERIGHSLFCQSVPCVERYVEYATEHGLPQLLLVAQAFAKIIAQLVLRKVPFDKEVRGTYAWWREYVHPKWWNVHGNLSKEEKARRKSLCKTALDLLLTAMKTRMMQHLPHRALDDILSEIVSLSNFGEIMGMLSCNVMVVEIDPSPCQEYFRLFSLLGSTARVLDRKYMPSSLGTKLKSKIEPTAISGSALYPLLSLANHSCRPNTSIEFLHGSNRASLVATRDIQPLEEICITYIPIDNVEEDLGPNRFRNYTPSRTFIELKEHFQEEEEEEFDESSFADEDDCASSNESEEECFNPTTVEERQKRLLEYGFTCACNLCIKELN